MRLDPEAEPKSPIGHACSQRLMKIDQINGGEPHHSTDQPPHQHIAYIIARLRLCAPGYGIRGPGFRRGHWSDDALTALDCPASCSLPHRRNAAPSRQPIPTAIAMT